MFIHSAPIARAIATPFARAVATPFALLAVPAAMAQTPPPTVLDTVVVTAAGLDQRIVDAVAHTSVITEREIRDSGQVDLPGLLRGLAGFDYTQSGGHGAPATAFLRGSEGRQMLVLLDGVAIGSATLGTAALEQLPLDEIERLEIVRGNVSALYGSGAVGGVIQVFTRQGRGAAAGSALLEIGSRSSRRLGAGWRGESGDTRYNLHVSHFRTAGQTAIDPALAPNVNPDDDGYRNTGLTASVQQQVSADHALNARLYLQQGRTEFDQSGDYPGGPQPTDTHVLDARLANLALGWNARLGPDWQSRLTVGANRDVSDARTNGGTPNRFHTTGRQIDWRHDLTLAEGQVLSATVGTLRQHIDSNTGYTSTTRRTHHGALAWNADLGRAQVQAALRHDRISGGVGSATTALLGGGWRLDDDWKLLGSLSTAFNAPTFNQLYYPFGFGNPDLKPEHARSLELGAQYASGHTLARLAWFRTHFTDLIDYQGPNGKPINVAKARIQGLELTASTLVEGWQLRLNLTAQQPEDGDGRTLQRRAREFGSVELARDFGAWRVRAQLTSTGSRPDVDYAVFEPVTLPGYTLLDLNGGWRLAPDLWLTARVTNVADVRYSTVYSYPATGREVHVGLAWKL